MIPRLSQDDEQMVVLAALVDGPKEQEDLERLVKWARDAYVDYQVLQLILTGKVVPSWDPEQGLWIKHAMYADGGA